jgi:hypothetical protein
MELLLYPDDEMQFAMDDNKHSWFPIHVELEIQDPEITYNIWILLHAEPLWWDQKAEQEFCARLVWQFRSDSNLGKEDQSRLPGIYDLPNQDEEGETYEMSLVPLLQKYPTFLNHSILIAVKLIRCREDNIKVPNKHGPRSLFLKQLNGSAVVNKSEVQYYLTKYNTLLEFARDVIAPIGVDVIKRNPDIKNLFVQKGLQFPNY